jgi:hypothetical protein
MAEAQVLLCRSIISHIKQAESLLASLKLQCGSPQIATAIEERYRIAWSRIRQVFAQIPTDWETLPLETVVNLLEYGSPDRQRGLTRPEKLSTTLECIVATLSVPRVFFSLEAARADFARVATYVTSSPLIKPSDRMGFLSFQGVLEKFAASFDDTATAQSISFVRQCGVLGALIERYQDIIIGQYEARFQESGPLGNLDLHFDTVMKVVNAYPRYMELLDALSEALEGMHLLPLSQALSDPGTIEALDQFENLLALNEKAHGEVTAAELALKAALAARDADEAEFEAILERVRSTA